MLEISSFGRMPRQLKDHFLLSAPQIFQEEPFAAAFRFKCPLPLLCLRLCAGRRPGGPRPLIASPAPTVLRTAVTGLASASGTLGYAVPSGTCSYYSTQKRSVIVKAIFQEGPPFRAGRRSMREDKTAVLQRPFCAFQGGLRFKAATALA